MHSGSRRYGSASNGKLAASLTPTHHEPQHVDRRQQPAATGSEQLEARQRVWIVAVVWRSVVQNLVPKKRNFESSDCRGGRSARDSLRAHVERRLQKLLSAETNRLENVFIHEIDVAEARNALDDDAEQEIAKVGVAEAAARRRAKRRASQRLDDQRGRRALFCLENRIASARVLPCARRVAEEVPNRNRLEVFGVCAVGVGELGAQNASIAENAIVKPQKSPIDEQRDRAGCEQLADGADAKTMRGRERASDASVGVAVGHRQLEPLVFGDGQRDARHVERSHIIGDAIVYEGEHRGRNVHFRLAEHVEWNRVSEARDETNCSPLVCCLLDVGRRRLQHRLQRPKRLARPKDDKLLARAHDAFWTERVVANGARRERLHWRQRAASRDDVRRRRIVGVNYDANHLKRRFAARAKLPCAPRRQQFGCANAAPQNRAIAAPRRCGRIAASRRGSRLHSRRASRFDCRMAAAVSKTRQQSGSRLYSKCRRASIATKSLAHPIEKAADCNRKIIVVDEQPRRGLEPLGARENHRAHRVRRLQSTFCKQRGRNPCFLASDHDVAQTREPRTLTDGHASTRISPNAAFSLQTLFFVRGLVLSFFCSPNFVLQLFEAHGVGLCYEANAGGSIGEHHGRRWLTREIETHRFWRQSIFGRLERLEIVQRAAVKRDPSGRRRVGRRSQ